MSKEVDHKLSPVRHWMPELAHPTDNSGKRKGKQTYLEYLRARIVFGIEVALWMEFDTELPTIKLETPEYVYMGDIGFPCMALAPILRKSPKDIASAIAPYVEMPELFSVSVMNGYLNVSFNRVDTLYQIILDTL